jgi:pyridoxine kinase
MRDVGQKEVLRQKRVLAIHDISGFGRCSLTVALPVLSAAGIECSVLPTAVLSTHTGGFTGFTFRDLSDDLLPIAQHWHALGLGFDAIYTGYLASMAQIELVRELIELLRRPDTLIVVDPVMADAGKLYANFPPEFPMAMRRLCAGADVVVPNLTEAALLLQRPYRGERKSAAELTDMLHALTARLEVEAAVLTGVSPAPGELGAASYEASSDEQSYYGAAHIEGGMYHGSGDVFSSVLVAALMRGLSLSAATKVAVTFTTRALKRSFEAGTDRRFGLNFEAGLSELSALIAAEGCS